MDLKRKYASSQGLVAGIFTATLLVNLLGLAIPLAMLQLFERIIPSQSFGSLQSLFVILCGVVAADTVLKIARTHLISANVQTIEARVMRDIIGRVFRGNAAKLNRIGSERLTERILAISKLQVHWNEQRMIQMLDLTFSVGFLALIWVLAGLLVLVPLAMIALVVLVAHRLRPTQLDALKVIEQNDGQRMSFLIEVLQNTRLLKVFGAEQRILRRYDSLHKSSADANEVLVKNADIAFTMSALMGQATTGVTSLIGGWLVIGNQIGLAELATSILLTGRTVQPFLALVFSNADIENATRLSKNFDEILSVNNQHHYLQPKPIEPAAIECRNIHAQCSDGTVMRLGNIVIPRNDITVIQGQRGAPAQAALQVLAGQRSAKQGNVLVSAGSDNNWPRIAFAPAHPECLDGALLDNLMDFAGRGELAERLKWMREFGLAGELSQIPGGLDASYSGIERGVGSPGFYKKLSLAATVARDADVIVLEDPFTYLDMPATLRLNELLVELSSDKTVILSGASEAITAQAGLLITLHPENERKNASDVPKVDLDVPDPLQGVAV